jgi:hypothetical protein
MAKLLFLDTNIYLDFYRMKNEVSLQLLREVEKLRDSLIVTYQVEMEFMKNRQTVILETLRNLKAPRGIPRIGILSEDAAVKSVNAACKELKNGVRQLNLKLQKILKDPIECDDVYKTLRHIFSKSDELNLTEDLPQAEQIFKQAQRRFTLGYPPRKKNDISIGDSINWEWLIYVASKRQADVYLVSRDGDFGVELEREYYLNDFLKDEFNRRVGNGVTIYFSQALTDVLKKFEVSVSSTQEKAELSLMLGRHSVRTAEMSGTYVKYLRILNEESLNGEIDSRIADTCYNIVEDEFVISLITETNAFDWHVDEYEILDIRIEDDSAKVEISFHLASSSDLDRPFCGDQISGRAEAEIDCFADVTYTVIEAKVEDWGD